MEPKWWQESWYARSNEAPNLHKIHCPVCHEYLGDRQEGHLFEGHCTECKTTFTFSPGDDIPSSKLDCIKNKSCDCMSCRKDDPEPPEEVNPYEQMEEDDFI